MDACRRPPSGPAPPQRAGDRRLVLGQRGRDVPGLVGDAVALVAPGLRGVQDQPSRKRSRGKQAPAKNGSCSGVMNTVIGQPPWPVMAWVAVM